MPRKKPDAIDIKIRGNLSKLREHEMQKHGSGSAVYGLGFLGALVYYITTATSITAAIVGILKAIVWPAFLVFGLMKFLGL